MNDTQIKTLEQVRRFLEGSAAVELCIDCRSLRLGSNYTASISLSATEQGRQGRVVEFSAEDQRLFTDPGQAPG